MRPQEINRGKNIGKNKRRRERVTLIMIFEGRSEKTEGIISSIYLRRPWETKNRGAEIPVKRNDKGRGAGHGASLSTLIETSPKIQKRKKEDKAGRDWISFGWQS